MGRPFFSARYLVVFSSIVAFGTASVSGQQPAPPKPAAPAAGPQQGIYLVFPFENAGAAPRLEWLGEGLEELTIQRLSAAGEQVYSHAGRLVELERYGLPHTSKFSRATMLHVAEDLDADFVIYGRFSAKGTSLTIESRILRVNPTSLMPALRETGTLDSLMDLHTRLVWRMLSANERKYRLNLAEFTKRQRPVRLDAFEHYTRGLLANEDDLRLRELHEAARLEPDWPDPDFALGEAYYSRRDYNSALAWFFKVPKSHDRYVEAVFASGVCRLFLNQPDHAEEDLAGLQGALRNNLVSGADVPEILNDLAIARARQGKTAAALADLRRATDVDPDEGDYPFNLGLLALQVNDAAVAAESFREAAGREPDNPEDRALLILSLEKAGKKPEADQEREAANEAFGPKGLPTIRLDAKNETAARLIRVKTQLDVTALRTEVVSPVSPARAADPASAAAHRGLAEIDRHQGKIDDAVKELQASLQSRDSAVVRTMLAKIYLEQKKPDLARAEVERALKLAPNYAEAKQLLEHLQNSKRSAKKPGGGAP